MGNEITVKLKCTIEEIDNILTNKGFKIAETFILDDTYLLKYTYEQVLATQAEQVTSKSNNIDNIPEIGKLIIKEGMKNNESFIQLSVG